MIFVDQVTALKAGFVCLLLADFRLYSYSRELAIYLRPGHSTCLQKPSDSTIYLRGWQYSPELAIYHRGPTRCTSTRGLHVLAKVRAFCIFLWLGQLFTQWQTTHSAANYLLSGKLLIQRQTTFSAANYLFSGSRKSTYKSTPPTYKLLEQLRKLISYL